MFIPVLINLIHYNKFGHMFMYYKFLYHCFHEHWPIIADEHYIREAEEIAQNSNYKLLDGQWHYHPLSLEEQKTVKRYPISSTISKQLEQRLGSRLNASLFLQKECCPELEEILEDFLSDIKLHSSESIEGFLMLEKQVKSVTVVAQKHDIPVLCIGMGPLRNPTYQTTAYLCRSDLYAGSDECQRRYQNFLKDFSFNESRFFTGKEILSFFLMPDYIKYLPLYDLEPQNEMLVAGTYSVMPTLFSYTTCGDCEILEDVHEIYRDQYRFRPNPSDPFQAMYRQTKFDRAQPGILSVVNTKRIASMGSNILFDAMLWGRTACCKTGLFPLSFQCQQDYLPRDPAPVADSFLTFFCFNYLIPFELMLDPEYIRWRLTEPSEFEIYQYHLDYYFKEKGIDKFILDLPEGDRLKALLYAQGYDAHLAESVPPAVLQEQFKQYIKQAPCRPTAASEAQKHLDIILNSTCWKMTAPLRKIMDWIKRF